MRGSFWIPAWVLVVFLIGASSSGASSPPLGRPDLLKVQEVLPAADLIFSGSVASIEYRRAEAYELNPDAAPHTFVTYRVERVFKGAVEGSTVTLRFYGGPVDADKFLYAPEHPFFDRGDRDVLLVKGNLSSGCPLVNCSEGRFRFIDGLVVNEDGRRLQVAPDGDLSIGPSMNLEDVNTTTMSDTISLRRVEVPEPGQPADAEPPPAPPLDPELDFTPEEFLGFMEVAVRATHAPEALDAARAAPFVSADIRRPFRLPPRQRPEYVLAPSAEREAGAPATSAAASGPSPESPSPLLTGGAAAAAAAATGNGAPGISRNASAFAAGLAIAAGALAWAWRRRRLARVARRGAIVA
jgi:hypothetical protein